MCQWAKKEAILILDAASVQEKDNLYMFDLKRQQQTISLNFDVNEERVQWAKMLQRLIKQEVVADMHRKKRKLDRLVHKHVASLSKFNQSNRPLIKERQVHLAEMIVVQE